MYKGSLVSKQKGAIVILRFENRNFNLDMQQLYCLLAVAQKLGKTHLVRRAERLDVSMTF